MKTEKQKKTKRTNIKPQRNWQSNIPVITLNVNGLNTPIKRKRLQSGPGWEVG